MFISIISLIDMKRFLPYLSAHTLDEDWSLKLPIFQVWTFRLSVWENAWYLNSVHPNRDMETADQTWGLPESSCRCPIETQHSLVLLKKSGLISWKSVGLHLLKKFQQSSYDRLWIEKSQMDMAFEFNILKEYRNSVVSCWRGCTR